MRRAILYSLMILAVLGGAAVVTVAAPRAVPLTHGRQEPTTAPAVTTDLRADDAEAIAPAAADGTNIDGCPTAGPAPVGVAGEFPRIVMPTVDINLAVRDGDGGTPPEGVWTAWFYPGLKHIGAPGKIYVYAHAHGNPQGSATGLFWNIHHLHRCDPAYLYRSATELVAYQVETVNLYWPSWNMAPLHNSAEEMLTLQTCNGWTDAEPKVIIDALPVRASSAQRRRRPAGR